MKFDFRLRWVAIALVLCGALYPMFGRARENARRSSCQSNLKQVSLAALQYVRDYDETWVLSPNWEAALYPYAKNIAIFSCPTSRMGYAYNINLSGALMTLVEEPQEMAMFYEPRNPTNADGGNDWNFQGVHAGGSNVAFNDGHVKWFKEKPTFWTPELRDKVGAKKRRDEESRRFRAENKRENERRRKEYEASKQRQRFKN